MWWVFAASIVIGLLTGHARSSLLLIYGSAVTVGLVVAFGCGHGLAGWSVALCAIGGLVACQGAFVLMSLISIRLQDGVTQALSVVDRACITLRDQTLQK